MPKKNDGSVIDRWNDETEEQFEEATLTKAEEKDLERLKDQLNKKLRDMMKNN